MTRGVPPLKQIVRSASVWSSLSLISLATIHGCTSTGGSAYEEPSPPRPHVREDAPTAQEMESGLASAEQQAPPPVTNGHSSALPEAATAAAAPEPVLPPVVQNPAPGIDEMVTIPTAQLTGSAFPGVDAVQEPVVVTKDTIEHDEALAQRVQELETKLASLEGREPREVKASSTTLQQQFEELRAKLAALETQPQQAALPAAEVTALQGRYDDLNSQMQALRDELKSPSPAPELVDERFAAIESELQRLKAQPAPAPVPDDESRQRIATLEAEVTALREKESASRTTMSDEARERIAQLETEIAQLRATPAPAPQPDEASQQRIAALEQEVAQLREQETKLRQELPEAAQQRIAGLEQQIEELRNQPPPVPQPDEASQQRIAVLEQEVANLREQETKLRQELPDAAQQRISELEQQITELRNQPPPVPAPAVDEETRRWITLLQEEVERLRNSSAQADAEAAQQTDARIVDLEKEIARLSAQPAPAPAVDDATRERIAKLEAEVAALRQAPAETATAELEETRARIQQLENQLTSMQAQQAQAAPAALDDDTRQWIAKLEQEVNRLREAQAGEDTAELEETRARIQQLESQIASLQAQPAPAPIAPADEEARQRIAQLETNLDALREQYTKSIAAPAAAPAPVPAPVFDTSGIDNRFAAMEQQVNLLRDQMTQNAATALTMPGEVQPVGDVSVNAALPPAEAFEPPMPESFEQYKIGARDLLEFQSFNDPTLDREVTVRYDGNISLPLIPDQHVAGLTRNEAENLVRQAYMSIFRDPQLSLLVRETESKTYTIMGDIEQPGVFPYTTSTKLIDAISMAGGLRRRNASSSVGGFVGITGQLTKAMIIRHRNGERMVIQYDLRGLGTPGNHASDAPVYFGDLIYVPEGVNLVYLLGESRNPVIVELTEGMTLLQMLALSGGYNASTARLRNVILIRQVDGQNSQVMHMNVREMLKKGSDFTLNPGDIVWVPQKALVRVEEFVRRFTGSITPVLGLYNEAVDAYYARDIARQLLDNDDEGTSTLEVLNQLQQFNVLSPTGNR